MARKLKPNAEIKKETVAKRSRDQRIREMLKENEKLLGKSNIEKNYKEAEEILTEIDDKALKGKSDTEIGKMLDDYEKRYRKNRQTYNKKQKLEDEKFFEEHKDSPEMIEKYVMARKTTSSAATARELAEKKSKAQIEKKYKAFRKTANLNQAKYKKEKEKEKER